MMELAAEIERTPTNLPTCPSTFIPKAGHLHLQSSAGSRRLDTCPSTNAALLCVNVMPTNPNYPCQWGMAFAFVHTHQNSSVERVLRELTNRHPSHTLAMLSTAPYTPRGPKPVDSTHPVVQLGRALIISSEPPALQAT